jgi:hypothetical protein
MVQTFVPAREPVHAQVPDHAHDLVPRPRLTIRVDDVAHPSADRVPAAEDVLHERGVHDHRRAVLAGGSGYVRRVEPAPAQDAVSQAVEEPDVYGCEPHGSGGRARRATPVRVRAAAAVRTHVDPMNDIPSADVRPRLVPAPSRRRRSASAGAVPRGKACFPGAPLPRPVLLSSLRA